MKDRRSYLWRLLLPLGLGIILSLVGDLTLYAVLPAYAATRAFSLASVGLLLSANRLVRLGSNPLVGLALSGSRRRGFVLAGLGAGVVATLFYLLARGTGLFLAGRIIWGVAWSMINIGSYALLLDAAGEQDRGWVSGWLQGFTFIGLAVGPLLGGVLSDRLGFSSALVVCTALSGVGFLIVFFTLPREETVDRRDEVAWRERLARLKSALRGWRGYLPGLRALLHAQNIATNYAYFAANFVADGILVSTISLYLRLHFGDQIALGGWQLPVVTGGGLLLALRAGVSALVAPPVGRFSDGKPMGKDLQHRRWVCLVWGAVIGAAGPVLIISTPQPWALALGILLAAAGSGAVITVAPPLVREINGDRDSAAVLGILMNSADLGMALAPLVTYALLSILPLEIIYLAAALVFLMALPLIVAAVKTSGMQVPARKPIL